MRLQFMIPAALIVLQAARIPAQEAERPRLYGSLVSMYGMADEFRSALDIGTTLEWPLFRNAATPRKTSALVGIRYRSFNPDLEPHSVDEDYRTAAMGSQVAIRRYPWEWLPGFFAQGLLGYEREWSRITNYTPQAGIAYYSPWQGPVIRSVAQTAEAAVGFGYLWKAGPLLFGIRFAFGPEWIFKSDYGESGEIRDESPGLQNLLRFHDLEIGITL